MCVSRYVSNLTDLAPPGEADDALMAFQHRMCVSADDDRIPWPKPDGYNADDFVLIQRAVDDDALAFNWSPMPGYPGPKKKYCLCCGITVAASDQPTLNKGWASASWERRQQIIADYTYFELGSFYYLANDPRVKKDVQSRFRSVGLCADEFVDNGHLPVQLYVRISNRLVGDYVMTQNNIANPRNKDDSIAVGDWSFDEHMTGKYAVPVPGSPGEYQVMLEGNFWPSITPTGNWYDVPFKIMLPKRGTGANLLVPVCLSASAVAYSSTRIENMFMSVGSAAGVAVKQLVDGEVTSVQDVNVSKVQGILTNTFRQRIHGPPGGGGGGGSCPSSSNTTCKQYVVSGAGSEAANGAYVLKGSQYGAPSYVNAATGYSLYRYGGEWRLVDNSKLRYAPAAAAVLILNKLQALCDCNLNDQNLSVILIHIHCCLRYTNPARCPATPPLMGWVVADPKAPSSNPGKPPAPTLSCTTAM